MNKVSKKEEVGENESPNLGCVEHHLSEMPIAGDYASSELRTLQIQETNFEIFTEIHGT